MDVHRRKGATPVKTQSYKRAKKSTKRVVVKAKSGKSKVSRSTVKTKGKSLLKTASDGTTRVHGRIVRQAISAAGISNPLTTAYAHLDSMGALTSAQLKYSEQQEQLSGLKNKLSTVEGQISEIANPQKASSQRKLSALRLKQGNLQKQITSLEKSLTGTNSDWWQGVANSTKTLKLMYDSIPMDASVRESLSKSGLLSRAFSLPGQLANFPWAYESAESLCNSVKSTYDMYQTYNALDSFEKNNEDQLAGDFELQAVVKSFKNKNNYTDKIKENIAKTFSAAYSIYSAASTAESLVTDMREPRPEANVPEESSSAWSVPLSSMLAMGASLSCIGVFWAKNHKESWQRSEKEKWQMIKEQTAPSYTGEKSSVVQRYETEFLASIVDGNVTEYLNQYATSKLIELDPSKAVHLLCRRMEHQKFRGITSKLLSTLQVDKASIQKLTSKAPFAEREKLLKAALGI